MAQGGRFPQATLFVGREEEQRRIRALLAQPDCRLLTLVGPGGIGKTQLALRAIEGLQEAYAHGVFVAPLQPVHTRERLVAALAEATNLSLSGQESPRTQLFTYLQNKEMLLLLDNFEQLLDAAGMLSDLLRAAPQLKLLATSREVLNVQEEWLFPVSGLPVPPSTQTEDLEAYGAVQLFLARARRVRPDFRLEDEKAGAVRICQLVEGMPLAIELAASWLRTLRCADIASEIQRSIDFLSTRLRDVPDRHRSMEAVFSQTWQMLDDAEQETFRRLSVFRGGFDRDAAQTVANATLRVLSRLVDKSLIGRREDGRYSFHELLRQYGAEKLAASREEEQDTRDRHCAFYARFMAERVDAINGLRQKRAAAEIAAELQNVRAAWEWAVAQGKVKRIGQICSSFFYFCQIQSRFLEGANALRDAAEQLDGLTRSAERDRTLALLLNHEGWLRIRVGEFDRAQATLSRSCDLFSRLEEPPPPTMGADPAVPLGIVRLIRGAQDEAGALAQEARQAAARRGDDQNLSFAHYLLTSVNFARGDYEAALHHAQQASTTAQVAGNRWFLAYALNEWGNVARAVGEYEEANRHFQASYALKQEFDDAEGMAVALNHLGDIAVLQGDQERAAQLYGQALSVYGDINDRGGRARALQGLARVALARGAYDVARKRLARSLSDAADIQFWPLVFALILDAADLFLQTGAPARGIELLTMVHEHPASDHESTVQASKRLTHWRSQVEPELYERAADYGRQAELKPFVAHLLTTLGEPLPASQRGANEQPLVEPLTDRELEVLALMADGYTNREIAQELTIALGTVKWYASEIYGKLGVSNRTQAAARARELGLLS